MGVCSKSVADRLIIDKRVSVNGVPAKVGMKVSQADSVEVDNRAVEIPPEPVFLLYHKPVGVVCIHDLGVENNIEAAVSYPQRVFAVGRLDKDSEGLMLLTNQGDLVNRLMRAENKHQKIYQVWVDQTITDDFIHDMASGVEILNTKTLPCQVERLHDNCFKITLVQGLNRQIRRMCKALGFRVLRLQRTHIIDFELRGLEPNQWREMTENEVKRLIDQTHGSNHKADT